MNLIKVKCTHVRRGKWNFASFVYALKAVGVDINNLFSGDAKASQHSGCGTIILAAFSWIYSTDGCRKQIRRIWGKWATPGKLQTEDVAGDE